MDRFLQWSCHAGGHRKTIDTIIGTFCIAHNHTLLHADRDFEPMEQLLGLKVVPTSYMVNEPYVRYG